MKKLLFGAAALLLMASCSGNSASEKTNVDSAGIADTTSQEATTKVASEQALPDSVQPDSIAKKEDVQSKETAKYDGMIQEYVATVNSFAKVSKNVSYTGNYSKGVSLLQKCWKQEEKINKIKNKLSPSQLEQFKKAKAKFKRANAPGRYAG